MSAGSPRIVVRLSPQELDQINQYLVRRNALACVAPWTLSEFIRSAVKEKLRHLSFRKGKRLKKGLPPDEEDQVGLGNLPTSEDPDSGINISGD